jgi:hypothetical protein
VGDGGIILHYNGSSWSTMARGNTNTLYSVWGSSVGEVFAVGAADTIMYYDSSTPTPMPPPALIPATIPTPTLNPSPAPTPTPKQIPVPGTNWGLLFVIIAAIVVISAVFWLVFGASRRR